MSAALETANELVFHQSRWGYHPVSYDTFRKLKALHKHYWVEARRLAAWFRWNGKAPQNRIRTQRIRDEIGRVTGRHVLGPWEEPVLSGVFTASLERRPWLMVPEQLPDLGVIAAFQAARRPHMKDAVRPLAISLSAIDELYERLATSR